MKILFTSDLHGREFLYGQMLSLARESSARCVVIGGDLLPTRLNSPFRIARGDSPFELALHAQMKFVDDFLAPAFRGFARENPGVDLLYIPGNHDWQTAMDHLRSAAPSARCLHRQGQTVDDVVFMGYGCVIDSSFWVKDHVRRDLPDSSFVRSRYPLVSTPEGLAMSLDGAYALNRPSMEEELAGISLEKPESTVCVFHSPPHGTGIDTLHNGRPIGSRAVAGFIERCKPLVSLHGHIHEAPYMSGFYHTMVGPTLAVNPGHHPRKLHAITFDTRDPAGTLSHSVFGTNAVTRTSFDVARDRYVRRIKGFFMKKVLMR